MRRKNKKNYGVIFMSVFIALIMVTSIIGYIFGGNQAQTSRYNGQKFTFTQNRWKTVYEDKSYFFSYLPSDLENIDVPVSISFNGVIEIDTTYDFNSTYKGDIAQSIFELNNILSQRNIFIREGFTTNSSFALPIITCKSASAFVPVIHYKSSNETKISHENNCIILESRDQNSFLALTDRIAYIILGIMG